VPGAASLGRQLASLVRNEPEKPEVVRETQSVRQEVRSLVQNWREMKQAQRRAQDLEEQAAQPESGPVSLGDLQLRMRLFKLRKAEVEHASRIWLQDESCWP
jgi:hypothetical protein